MSKAVKDSPHPVDIHVGERLRQLRAIKGVTQEQVGKTLGISFQQLQKYEKGSNRLSASRLYDISVAFAVSPAFFFEGLGAEYEASQMPEFTREIVHLIRCYNGVESQPFRAAFVELLKTANSEARS